MRSTQTHIFATGSDLIPRIWQSDNDSEDTMNITIKSDETASLLRSLPALERTAFAASCCERMIPLYEAFWALEGWGRMEKLRAILDRIWLSVATGQGTFTDATSLIEECESLIPEPGKFHSVYAGLAVNAVATVIYTLQHTVTGDLEKVLLVRQNTLEAVERYLFVVNTDNLRPHEDDPGFHRWLESTPLMAAEFRKQMDDIKVLSTPPGLASPKAVTELRKTSESVGIHPIKRRLVKARDASHGG